MEIRANWSEPEGESVISIGNYDGVHLGHRHLLRKLSEIASGKFIPLVMTFEPHPLSFLDSSREPFRLIDLRTKSRLLASEGVGQLNVVSFNKALSMLAPERFVQMLVEKLKMRALIVGSDFRFGHRRAGDVSTLTDLAKQYSFELIECGDVQLEGERISSKLVRATIAAGEFQKAEGLLGHSYRFGGRIIGGSSLGSELGCPTANLRYAGTPPLDGIYAAHCYLEGVRWPAALYVGRRTTFAQKELVIEAHLLGLDKQVYGNWLEVEPKFFLHGERTYAGPQELSEGIAADVAACKKMLSA